MDPLPLNKKRQYFDGCASAHAMDLVGERWALLVIRELMLGPKRFSDIKRNLAGISANVLTQRLEELEALGIVIRRKLPPPALLQVYDLTDWGRELEPAFQALGRWAARSPFKGPGPMSVNSLMMSFTTMFDAGRAGDLSARMALLLEGEPCHLIIERGEITAERGELDTPDVSLEATTDDLADLVYLGAPFDAWLKRPGVAVTGDAKLLRKLTEIFPLPDRVNL